MRACFGDGCGYGGVVCSCDDEFVYRRVCTFPGETNRFQELLEAQQNLRSVTDSLASRLEQIIRDKTNKSEV